MRHVSIWVVLFLCASATVFGDGYTGNIKVRVLMKTDTTSIGQPVEYPDIDDAEVTAIEVEIPPGGETGWHRHPVPGYAVILSGELTLETEDGKSFVFSADSPRRAFAEVVKVRHNGRNLGKKPVTLIAFFTGEKGKPFTEKVEAPAVSPRKP
jgi:quercetin dioxygenase-like cupin family protein